MSTGHLQVIESENTNSLPFVAMNWAKPSRRETTRNTIEQGKTKAVSGMIFEQDLCTRKVCQNTIFAWIKFKTLICYKLFLPRWLLSWINDN